MWDRQSACHNFHQTSFNDPIKRINQIPINPTYLEPAKDYILPIQVSITRDIIQGNSR